MRLSSASANNASTHTDTPVPLFPRSFLLGSTHLECIHKCNFHTHTHAQTTMCAHQHTDVLLCYPYSWLSEGTGRQEVTLYKVLCSAKYRQSEISYVEREKESESERARERERERAIDWYTVYIYIQTDRRKAIKRWMDILINRQPYRQTDR